MPIPDFQSTMRPLLVEIADGQAHDFNDVFPRICQFFELTEEERAEMLPSGKQTVIRNRVSWARTFLKKAGLLAQPGRRMMKITQRGIDVLADCPTRVDTKYLKRFPEFAEFHGGTNKAVPTQSNDHVADAANTNTELTPVEMLDQAIAELNNDLNDQLLENIIAASPKFFEQLVVDLMLALGYGGSRAEAGRATQFSNDGGIDGIIKEDVLGLDVIYLQAKRYKIDSIIGRPDIQKFAGALDMQRAKKGVFITTSSFSKDATEYVELIEKKIVLIDGNKLTQLMVDYNLGVSTKQRIEIKAIDSDYFLED